MRYIICLLTFSMILISCGQNDTKQKELELKEKELDLRQQQLDSIEKLTSRDTSQQAIPSNNIPAEQMVLDIRDEVKRINALKLTSKKYNFECDTEGTIIYYTDNGNVVKIAIEGGGIGDGSSNTEYYYKANKLIFTYEVYIGGPAIGPETKTEYRTYVNNDKAIKYMENKNIMACTTCQFNGSSQEYKLLVADNINKIQTALCDWQKGAAE